MINLESVKSMNNYSNAYAEVYTILEYLDEKDKNKIPQKVLDAIEQSRNPEYIFDLEDDIELQEQILLPETRAILFNLFRDYLAEPWQKEKILKMQEEERKTIEDMAQMQYMKKQKELQKQYPKDIFDSKEKNIQENILPVEYKESVIKKILRYFKNLFKRK